MKLLSKFKKSLPIILIVLLASFLRLVDLDLNPPALYGDELTLVYDAYSILKTGHDQTGAFLPLTFSMSEGRPPLYVYLSIPLVAIFGPNALSARMLSAFAGVGIVILIYLLLQKLISKQVALIAAFFIAISPWDLSLSRGGFETHLALFLSLLGVVTFIRSDSKGWLLLISAFSFGLALHTYHSYKIVVPLFLPFLIWFTDIKSLIRKKNFRTFFIASIVIFAVFVGVWLYQAAQGAEVRFKNTSIFVQTELATSIIEKVNNERTLDTSPISAWLHNKPVEYISVLGNNYFSHFSFDFLFGGGDKNPRHNQASMGEMYIVQFLLVLLGVIYLFWQDRRLTILLGTWLMVAPIATIVVSPAHALRSSFLLPPLVALSSVGFVFLLNLAKRSWSGRVIFIVVVLGMIIQFIFLVDRIYFLSPRQFSNFWGFSAKVASEEALKNQENFDYIILSDRIDSLGIGFPVYAAVDPRKVIEQNSWGFGQLGKYNFKQFNNIYVGSIPNYEVNGFLKSLSGKVLYLEDAQVSTDLVNHDIIYGNKGLPILLKATR